MFQVRIHGRGGQGVVTATELLSMAAFDEGRHAQAFPSFGSERTGAPVVAFCRIADGPIRVREPVVEPDAVVVQDATLLHQVDVFQGLGPSAYVLINSLQTFEDLGLGDIVASQLPERLATVPATELALEHLGRAVPNAALLGGFAALTQMVSITAVITAIRERFPPTLATANVAAASAAYDLVRLQMKEYSDAQTG